uniref:NudA protein n=2 Tax=Endopterygota TaxID=33392 RepID=A0A0C9RDV4_9HYME
MEAMRKLDATLVAYLAGETKLQSKQMEPELELDLNSQNESNVDDNDEYVLEEFADPVVETVENITREELQLFRRIKSMKLQLEALTLEPEGTKRMELLQNDTRPIFTVECQLSHELIQNLPRYEMFHIMQFESEKFQSLTQCTRFGQEAQRDINLTPLIDELDNTLNGNGNGNAAAAGDAPNFGRIHFAVWWREPGTCLNEMLGMGVFELRELYDAALLEQCKRITIQRRGVPLANIYLKINLLLCTLADTNNNNNAADLSYEAALQAMKQQPGGGNKRKGGSGKGAAKSSASGAAAAANTSATSSNTTGEYQVERLVYLKDTDIQ